MHLRLNVCVCVCVNSMSFTPNIVNIHRTILHVLALHFRGEKIWFTSLEHHKIWGKRGRKGVVGRRGGQKEECQTPVQGCEVIVSLFLFLLAGRPFVNSLKQQGQRVEEFLRKKHKKKGFLSSY